MRAVTIYENGERGEHCEMDINYNPIKQKVDELNELGVDITLQEIGDLIEGKFSGVPSKADVRTKEDGTLLFPQYTVIKH